ncbi:MAG: hypothetical protein RSB29_06190 [Alistipes sp.]
MRSWLSIILLLFITVVVQVDAQVRPAAELAPTTTTVLSQGDRPSSADNAPLFAVSAASVTSQSNGAETLSVKSRQLPSSPLAWMRSGLRHSLVCMQCLPVEVLSIHLGWCHAVDHYVFALRKIII